MNFLSYLFGLLLQFPSPPNLAEGDTGDTAEDTDTEDTDTEDTNTEIETGDTGVVSSDDSGELKSAMELAGENGGFGCATLGTGSALALWGSIFVIGLRREE